jgi:hypothetical protein
MTPIHQQVADLLKQAIVLILPPQVLAGISPNGNPLFGALLMLNICSLPIVLANKRFARLCCGVTVVLAPKVRPAAVLSNVF